MLYHGQSVVFDGFAWKNSRIRKGEQFPPIFVRVWMSMWFSVVRWRETHILITANRKMMYVADVVVFVVIVSIVVSHMNVNTIQSGKETANHIEKKFPFLCFSSRQWITSKEFIESLLRQIGLREYLCDMKVITITQRYGGVGVCRVPNYVQIVLGGFKQWKLVNVLISTLLGFCSPVIVEDLSLFISIALLAGVLLLNLCFLWYGKLLLIYESVFGCVGIVTHSHE